MTHSQSQPSMETPIREAATATDDLLYLADLLTAARDEWGDAIGSTGEKALEAELHDILWNDKGTFAPVLYELADRRRTPSPSLEAMREHWRKTLSDLEDMKKHGNLSEVGLHALNNYVRFFVKDLAALSPQIASAGGGEKRTPLDLGAAELNQIATEAFTEAAARAQAATLLGPCTQAELDAFEGLDSKSKQLFSMWVDRALKAEAALGVAQAGREPAPTKFSPGDPVEVRIQNEAIDEIVIRRGDVHIEQMSADGWFMGIDASDGSYWQFWFGSKNGKTPVDFRHTETVSAAEQALTLSSAEGK